MAGGPGPGAACLESRLGTLKKKRVIESELIVYKWSTQFKRIEFRSKQITRHKREIASIMASNSVSVPDQLL